MSPMPNFRCSDVELALRAFEIVLKESEKVERYVGGLPDMIHGNVAASKPKTMQEATEMDNSPQWAMSRKVRNCKRNDCPELKNQNHGNQAEGTKARGMVYWAIIRFEFYNFIKYFEKFGCLARGCNASFIVLIPKNSDPVDLGDYRPISLIGCMYKVLSKLLSRRLCKVIHKLIRPNQTTFLSGRQILDGIQIANEIVNYAKKEKLKLLIFKVDFEKAFDSVNWKFLIDIMSQMGFSAKWCKLIHACLSSAAISVLINGSPSKEFSMERGLRQGDPMSPFLFLIIAEALYVGSRLTLTLHITQHESN
ncbi:cysteine-rich receptor-like protein kinase [Tanacetum coccineum]